jgi:putative transposase
MKKYDLLRSGDTIIRVLEVRGDKVLVIDCIKRTMPVWVGMDDLESCSECTSGDLSAATGVVIVGADNLDVDQRKIMYERYTMIAPILPFVADDRMRSRLKNIECQSRPSEATSVCIWPTWMWLLLLRDVGRMNEC